MVFFCPLFSGSSGNSTFIGVGTGGRAASGVLIDAGRSAKAILAALAEDGIDPAAIKAIVLTHSHSDHVSALRVLQKKLNAPVYGSAETLLAVAREGLVEKDAELIELSSGMEIAGLYISPFPTPHDAEGSLGFVIEAEGRRMGYATDLGIFTDEIADALTGCCLVMLESNYEDNLLQVSPRYPYELKRRIASEQGHLSNSASAAAAVELTRRGCYHLVLAHLSAENNSPDLARQSALSALCAAGFCEERDFALSVCSRSGPIKPIKL